MPEENRKGAGKEVQREIEQALGPIIDKVEDKRRLLEDIAEYFRSITPKVFKEQGRKIEWKPRSVPSVPGIIADIKKGANIRPYRFDDRPALINTGRLRDSWTARVVRGRVIWGSNLDYAAIHQEGGSTRMANPIPRLWQQGDEKVQREMKKVKEADEDTFKALINNEEFTFQIPARPVSVTQKDLKIVRTMAEKHVREA